jgi:hypothetical protein
MMKQIMKRAWEIYRTLVGDRIAKLSMALRQAWKEMKTSKTRNLRQAEINFIREYIAKTAPAAVRLFDSQAAKGSATVTEKIGFVTMMIGNIDVEVTKGDYCGMNIKVWYCGTPINEI